MQNRLRKRFRTLRIEKQPRFILYDTFQRTARSQCNHRCSCGLRLHGDNSEILDSRKKQSPRPRIETLQFLCGNPSRKCDIAARKLLQHFFHRPLTGNHQFALEPATCPDGKIRAFVVRQLPGIQIVVLSFTGSCLEKVRIDRRMNNDGVPTVNPPDPLSYKLAVGKKRIHALRRLQVIVPEIRREKFHGKLFRRTGTVPVFPVHVP